MIKKQDFAQVCLKLRHRTCGYGGIGIRARLRIWCREAWGFESLYPHEERSVRCENDLFFASIM